VDVRAKGARGTESGGGWLKGFGNTEVGSKGASARRESEYVDSKEWSRARGSRHEMEAEWELKFTQGRPAVDEAQGGNFHQKKTRGTPA